MKKGDQIFVYGTLRRSEKADLSTHFHAKFVGEDRINGDIYNLGWYPGAKVPLPTTPFEGTRPCIVGDVFDIEDDSLVAILDAYEGYPNLYTRVEVESEGGRIVWVYTYNHPLRDADLVPSGDWLCREFRTVMTRVA